MNDINCIVLGANRWRFNDNQTGELLEGTTVHFVYEESDKNDSAVGLLPKKTTLDYRSYDKFIGLEFPFHAKAKLEVDLRGKKPTLKVMDFEQIKPAKVG